MKRNAAKHLPYRKWNCRVTTLFLGNILSTPALETKRNDELTKSKFETEHNYDLTLLPIEMPRNSALPGNTLVLTSQPQIKRYNSHLSNCDHGVPTEPPLEGGSTLDPNGQASANGNTSNSEEVYNDDDDYDDDIFWNDLAQYKFDYDTYSGDDQSGTNMLLVFVLETKLERKPSHSRPRDHDVQTEPPLEGGSVLDPARQASADGSILELNMRLTNHIF